MKNIDLSKLFYKAMDTLRLSDSQISIPMPITDFDYVIGEKITLFQAPSNFDITFSVGRSESNGAYLKFNVLLWYQDDDSPTEHVMTVLTSTHYTKESLKIFAYLGSKIIFFAREELAHIIDIAFSCNAGFFEIYSLTQKDGSFSARTINCKYISEHMDSFAPLYRKVAEGEIQKTDWISFNSMYEYILGKSLFDNLFDFDKSDIIVYKTFDSISGEVSATSVIWGGWLNGNQVFESVDFHTYLKDREEA